MGWLLGFVLGWSLRSIHGTVVGILRARRRAREMSEIVDQFKDAVISEVAKDPAYSPRCMREEL